MAGSPAAGTELAMAADPSTLTATLRAQTATAGAFIEALRPGQWAKNGFVFAALIFSRSLGDWRADVLVALAAYVFCEVASAVYLVNDVLDADEDRQHPTKCLRPIASGRILPSTAVFAALILGAAGLTTAWVLSRPFFLVMCLYAGINLLYSWWLKHIVLVDVFAIAAGFVLRVLGGALAIHVEVSPWLIVCTTLLALFLALSKRRHELVLLGEKAPGHRANLTHYSPYFLDQLISIVTASTLMSYALYTLSDDARIKFPGKRLELTVPFVLFGIFRYLYLVHQREGGGNPTRLLFSDPVLLTVVVMWAASVIAIIYG